MAKKNIVIYPDPILRKLSEPVFFSIDNQNSLNELLDDMYDTLSDPRIGNSGLGLAAVQIGVLQRVFIMNIPEHMMGGCACEFPNAKLVNGKYHIEFINPKVTPTGNLIKIYEGCLSIPGYAENLQLFSCADITYCDRTGQEHSISCSGVAAICAQHEIDHLNGILFVDRLSRLKRNIFNKWISKKIKVQQRISKQILKMNRLVEKQKVNEQPGTEQHGNIEHQAPAV